MYNENYFEHERDDDHEPVIYAGSLRHIQHHLEAVLDALYGNGSIDLVALENSLDEVSSGLGLRLPNDSLNIKRSDTKICQFDHDTIRCQEAAV